jgi:DNA-binding response OmpR family regulator
MSPHRRGPEGRYIVVADEDRTIANVVIEILTADGHAVFLAHDGLSAMDLALKLKVCDLVISNSRVGGRPGVELIHDLRRRLPWVPVLYLANEGRSTPELERRLPPGVRILREPFTADELREAVRPLLAEY